MQLSPSGIISLADTVAVIATVVITSYYYRKQTLFQQQLEEMRRKAKLRGEFDYTFLDRSVPLKRASIDAMSGNITTPEGLRSENRRVESLGPGN